MRIPIIDIGPLVKAKQNSSAVINAIEEACKDMGFFYIIGHGLDQDLQQQLERLSQEFFDQPAPIKLAISMEKGGKAWRGYFPLEAELTSGKPDLKEGLYFGEELADDHPMVQKGVPLHGSNLYPDIEGFDLIIEEYMNRMTFLGEVLMQAIALSLKLPADYFNRQYMVNPIRLFRIFHYPPAEKQKAAAQWGVGEHTDYGVLTILKQDRVGGLQIFSQGKWIDAPYLKNSFICNIGDMLDYLTGGYYRSTPHRVYNQSKSARLSFPFFYDLDFNAVPEPIDLSHLGHSETLKYSRWDHSDLHTFNGTYGEYLTRKISKVFPQLRNNVL